MPKKLANPCSKRKVADRFTIIITVVIFNPVPGLQMSFIFFLIFCIIHIFYKEHIFIIGKTIKVIKNQIEYPTNYF